VNCTIEPAYICASAYYIRLFAAEKIPAPSEGRYPVARVIECPMSAEKRKRFIRLFLPGINCCRTILCFFHIVPRYTRNFIADMWKEMGYINQPHSFKTETPTTIIILALIGSMILVKNNFRPWFILIILSCWVSLIAGPVVFLFVAQFDLSVVVDDYGRPRFVSGPTYLSTVFSLSG